jgi:hypothetical protein
MSGSNVRRWRPAPRGTRLRHDAATRGQWWSRSEDLFRRATSGKRVSRCLLHPDPRRMSTSTERYGRVGGVVVVVVVVVVFSGSTVSGVGGVARWRGIWGQASLPRTGT